MKLKELTLTGAGRTLIATKDRAPEDDRPRTLIRISTESKAIAYYLTADERRQLREFLGDD